MVSAKADGDEELLRDLQSDYDYDAVQTCAVDGMCQTACPVDINTGDLVRRLRADGSGSVAQGVWQTAARHWGASTRIAARGLDVAASLPSPLVTGASELGRRIAGTETVPLWTDDLPRGGPARPRDDSHEGAGAQVDAQAVFFSACIGSMFGPSPSGHGAGPAFRELCARAGVAITQPAGLSDLCCGTPWKSKGLTAGHSVMRERVLPALWEASREGVLPVVCDASSCTEGLHDLLGDTATGDDGPYAALVVVDAVQFVLEHVVPRLSVRERLATVTVHPTCSSTRIGSADALAAIAAAIANEVHVPVDWSCCAFAGDRGLLHPELTASATRREAGTVASRPTDAYVSCNRTCEIGMSRATGHEYQHVLEVLEQVSR
jgi:D-lactate dehydrogenase